MSSGRPASAVPPRGRRRSASQSRQAILDATRALLEERRLEDLTVAEIVERAGISRPTFYSSFGTKYGVVAALVAGAGDDIYELWRPFFAASGPITRTDIRAVAIETVARWREQAALFSATVEGWHTDPEINEVWSETLDRFSEALLDRLHRSRSARPADEMLAASLVWHFERCLYLAVSTSSVFARSDDELADVVAAVWAGALTPADAPELI